MANRKKNNVVCSFCGKSQDDVDRHIAGPGVYICSACIRVCSRNVDRDL